MAELGASSVPVQVYCHSLMISAGRSGFTLAFAWDALGRKLSETGPFGITQSQYDLAGRRTRLTWPDGFHVDYDHLVTGEVIAIRDNGAVSGAGVRAVFAYDDLGRRVGLVRGNGSTTVYGYDGLSRLTSLGHDLAGTAHDVTIGLTYNPASQVANLPGTSAVRHPCDSAARLDELKFEFAGSADGLTSQFFYDPEGQIASTLRSNHSSAWTGHGPGPTPARVNALGPSRARRTGEGGARGASPPE